MEDDLILEYEAVLELEKDMLITELSSDYVKKIKYMSESLRRQARFHRDKAENIARRAAQARHTIIKLEKKNKRQLVNCRRWIQDLVEIENRLNIQSTITNGDE
ncbi:MAG: hypothetical protein HF314_12120 [Ignavibacteria bacterium]|jgi:hypothetical protein|nr:hypothetical protein [Ignavibacteria bacterium]MCU7503817.1 hypothetical protein [Ignavibacteria bacterium]MCU7517169.1 hypothetical protein [Ignavibacteria bacterium]